MSISDFIATDLRDRIEAGNALPKLTLAGLARHYSVSMMPVRTAVSALVDENLIQKKGNGRLAIADADETESVPPPAPPMQWMDVVLQDAIRESLRGQARKWTINATAERYGIGRAVVQSIFQRLAGMGILEHAPRCGWNVRPFREADLNDYLRVRVLLELEALDACRDRLDPAVLERIYDRNQPGGRNSPEIDNSLHRYWVDLSGNHYIRDFFDRHGAYYAALYEYAAIGDAQLGKIARRHRAILSALLARKWRVARDNLTEDIESLRPILLETIRDLGQDSTVE